MKALPKPSQEAFFRIGDLARETGKTVRALRYYEELGLLQPVSHTEGGFRLYRPEDVKRVRLIERLQELGFTLERVRGIVAAWRKGESGERVAEPLQELLAEGLREIRLRMKHLHETEREMMEALHFLSVCRTCTDHPARQVCTPCEKGDHTGRLPSLMDALAS